MEANLVYHQSTIHYSLHGQGPLLLCLHGYNHYTRKFDFLVRHLQHRFTILAIDMPFHGLTNWQEQRPFVPEDLHAIVLQLQPQAAKALHLLGYSMGGRIALAYFQQYPEAVKTIALIAPDGLRINGWYRLATHSRLGERFFHHTMHNPAWLHRLIRTTDRYKLAPKSLTNVASYFLNDEQGRMQLYNRWTSLSRFRPNLRQIHKLLVKYHVPVRILLGDTDSVISWKDGIRFQKQNPQLIHVNVIAASHFLMNERYTDDILKLFPEGNQKS